VSQTRDTAKLRAKFPKVPVSVMLFLRRFSNSLSSLRLPPSAEVLSVVFAYEFPLGIARSYGRPDCSSVRMHEISHTPRNGMNKMIATLDSIQQ
jgi:hypothetical protein